MPDGTVRGRVDLATPARAKLASVRQDAQQTTRSFEALGRAVDGVFGAEAMAKKDAYRKNLRGLRDDVQDTTRAVQDLRGELRLLGQTTARPNVDVRGLISATGEVAALNAQLDRLDRRRAVARVGVAGAPAAAAQGAAARGGGGQGLRSVGLGPFNLGSATGLLAIGAALPAISSVAGAATALTGTIVGGAGAAGAGALASGGALAVGLGTIAAVAVPAKKGIEEAGKAQTKYTEAVKQYGRSSTQAVRAKYEMDQAFSRAPRGTRRLIADARAFGTEWRKATRGAQGNLTGFLGDTVGTGRRLIPTFAPAAERTTGALRREGAAFTGGLFDRDTPGRITPTLGGRERGAIGKLGVSQGAAMFDENLTQARRFTQFGTQAMIQIGVAARPFLLQATTFMGNWAEGWARSTSDIDRTRSRLRPMVDDFRSIARFGGATFRLLRDLTLSGHVQGRGMLDRTTDQLNTWDRWVQRNPEKMRAFFSRTVRQTEQLAGGLWSVAKAIGQAADDLGPLLSGLAQLTSLAGGAGLLQPGALALGIGAWRGARGMPRGPGAAGTALGFMRGGGGGGMGAGQAAALGVGAGRLGAGAGLGGRASFLESRRGVTRSGAFLMGGATTGTAGALERRRLARGGSPGALSRLGGTRLGAGAMGAARGAGRAFWPVAAGLGVLDFAGTQGNVGERTQAALSGATLGIVPRPTLGSDQRRRGAERAEGFIGGLPADATPGSIERLQRRLRANQAKLRRPQHAGGLIGGAFHAVTGPDRGEKDPSISSGEARALSEENKKIRAELRERSRLYRSFANDRSRQRAGNIMQEFAKGFDQRSQREGPVKAMRTVNRGILDEMKSLRPAGRRELAQQSVSWAREMARQNPKLVGPYKRLQRDVIAQFKGMNEDIRIVNGQILTGSKSQWESIANQIASAARRGVDKTSGEFRRLRQVAIGALMQMGFSRRDAAGIFKLQGGDSQSRRIAAVNVRQGPSGAGQSPQAQNRAMQRGRALGGRLAGGGRLQGRGLRDTIQLGPNDVGAPGEVVLNRFTERDIDRDLVHAGKQPVGNRLKREHRRHHARHQRIDPSLPHGGIAMHAISSRIPARFSGGGGGGSYPDAMGALPGLDALAWFINKRFGLRTVSGLRPNAITTSGNPSDHGWGGAVDLSNGGQPTPQMDAAWRFLASSIGGGGVPRPGVFSGGGIKQMLYRTTIGGNHFNHIHVALQRALASNPQAVIAALSGGKMPRGMAAMAGAGGAAQQMKALRARRSGLGGVPGALADRATQVGAAAITQRVNRRLARMGGAGATGAAPTLGKGSLSRSEVMQLWIAAGGAPGMAAQMASIAFAESRFNPRAHNASGASGLWQIMMPLHRSILSGPNVFDPMTNARAAVQLSGGGRNLGPWAASKGAWGKSLGGRMQGPGFGGWFAQGGTGTASRPTLIGIGDRRAGREEFSVQPLRPKRTPAGGRGGRGGHSIDLGGVHFTGPVSLKSDADVNALGEKVGKHVVKKVLAALDDEVSDSALT